MRIAVFDLDGTITRHDTFLPYLRGWLRRHPRPGFGVRAFTALLRYPLGFDRGRLKSRLIRAGMSGASRAEIRSWTAEYVAGLGDREFCLRSLATIELHRAAGDRLVLLSASIDLYVPDIGRRLGFDETICTEVAWRGDRLDGALVTENRRAEEKLRCVEALRVRFQGARFAAYGNARSDFHHLAVVEEPVLVNAGSRLCREAEKQGFRTEDWCNK